jgi:hypothetical protein
MTSHWKIQMTFSSCFLSQKLSYYLGGAPPEHFSSAILMSGVWIGIGVGLKISVFLALQ